MEWSAVTTTPTRRMLRQFAGLWTLAFMVAALWRLGRGQRELAAVLASLGLGLGSLGLWRPVVMRYIFTGWMIAVFPIGWMVSRLALALVFFGVFTPLALVFRSIGRDALGLRRGASGSYWTHNRAEHKAADYLRQF